MKKSRLVQRNIFRLLGFCLQVENHKNCHDIQGWGQILKKNSNLCGDTADFTPPPPYLVQDFMQSPVIDM